MRYKYYEAQLAFAAGQSEVVETMFQHVESQMRQLLFYFQRISNVLKIDVLKREGIIGDDGEIHIFGNAWEVIRQLKKDGWIIETDRKKPSRYIFRGHYSDFTKDVQMQFIKIKAVSLPPHLFRTRPECDGMAVY